MQYGFIGCGNMGGAVARALCHTTDAKEVLLANRTMSKAKDLAQELGCAYGTNEDVASTCEYIFLCVKPQMMKDMLEGIADILQRREKGSFVLVSMAAGLTISKLLDMVQGDYPIIRIMPNTPVLLGKGMIQYCHQNVNNTQLDTWLKAMALCGVLDEVSEKDMDAASSVSGCGPAFVYAFIEALADGGVACGLPRQKAMTYAAQMVFGSASMVLETGKHPGQLKDEVCSPGGSTIQGVRTLEEHGFRGAVMDSVIAAYEKTKDLGK